MSDPWAAFNPRSAEQPAAPDPWAAFNPRAASADAPQDAPGGPLVVTVAPRRQNAPAIPAPAEPSTWDNVKNTAVDVAQSAVSGVNRGVIGLAGLPGDIGRGIGNLSDYVAEKITGEPVPKVGTGRTLGEVLGSANLRKQYEAVTSPLYEPQTTAGEFAKTVGEFLPSSGGGVGNALRFAVAPGIVSEAAGQLARNVAPELETPARVVGALGASGIAAMATRPNTAEAAVAAGMRGVDDATVNAAGRLMQEAQQRGINLTWPEAIGQVTNGGARGLTNMQRVVEGSQGGGDIMGGFMAQRPAQIEAAARREFGAIAPQSQAPSTIGPAIGQAAGERISDVRGAINAATDPLYTAAAPVRVPPQEFARIQALPGYAEAVSTIKGTPQLARYVQGLPEDSVGFLNEVKKQLGTSAENAAGALNANRNMQVAAGYGLDEGAVRQAASAASPQYAQALAVQEQARKQFLEPLLQGPIGKLAEKDLTTKQAIGVLFPPNPLPGSAPEIIDTVGALAKKNPMAARQLVRAHIESTFNEATQQLQSGANQFGGAGFAAVLRGNTQQAENLAAAIQGVAGPKALAGFDQFLDIMSATGQRQRIGSQTAFNQEAQDILRRGGMVGEAANTIATGGIKLPGKVKEAYEQWRLGRNTEQIARLFTDPNAISMFRRLGQAAPGSSQSQAIAARLAIMAQQGRTASQPTQ